MSNDSNSIIKTIVNCSAWSFIGVLLATSFFYWQEYRNPFDFRVELVDEFNLIEIKEKIKDLKIIYKDEDILVNKKEIKVVRFKISNLGDTILQTYYDQLESFGLGFGKAKVLNVEIISSNSDDLKNKLIKKNSDKAKLAINEVLFSKVIFESGDIIQFKVTLLQTAGETLSVNVLGNLANVKGLKVIAAELDKSEPVPAWIWVIIGYFILIITSLILVFLSESVDKRKRQKKVLNFKSQNENLVDLNEEIIDLYLADNSKNHLITSILRNDRTLDLKEYVEDKTNKKSVFPSIFSDSSNLRFQTLPNAIFNVDGKNVTFNPVNESFIRCFFDSVL